MSAALDWRRDGRDWPNKDASRFVRAGGLDWHVQVAGQGPVLLLVHGTAASTHSFRDLLPRLSDRFTIVAPDLPGHGFTGKPGRNGMTLPGMARSLAALTSALDLQPSFAAGHSAGAAVLVRMALDGALSAQHIVSVNGALLPFRGVASHLAPGLARLLFVNPITSRIISFMLDEKAVGRTLAGMGSRIDRRGVALYARLLRRPGHVESALAMMANWDLATFEQDLGRLRTPLTLMVGTKDKAVPSQVAEDVRTHVPHAEIRKINGVGHLLHEERPDLAADLLLEIAARHGF